jgi:hypothetical protein
MDSSKEKDELIDALKLNADHSSGLSNPTFKQKDPGHFRCHYGAHDTLSCFPRS